MYNTFAHTIRKVSNPPEYHVRGKLKCKKYTRFHVIKAEHFLQFGFITEIYQDKNITIVFLADTFVFAKRQIWIEFNMHTIKL